MTGLSYSLAQMASHAGCLGIVEGDIRRLPWGLSAIVLVWVAVLVLIFWHRGRVWAVARQTVLQAIRMRLAVVLILFLILLMAFLPVLLRHDNTPSGRIRILVTYAVYAAQFLLCVLTLFLSTATLCSEIKEKQIYCLDTKPVPRWCILAGKWVGIMIIDLALVAAVGVILYVGIRFQARMPAFGRAKITSAMPPFLQQEIKRARMDNQVLQARLLRAREVSFPKRPDIRKMVDDRYEEMRKRGSLPSQRSEAWTRMMLDNMISNEVWAVPPAGLRVWEVTGLPRDLPADDWVTVRFLYRGVRRPPKNEITGLWQIGRFDKKSGKFTNPYVARIRLTKKCDTYHDVPVRASLVDPATGTLSIFFYNPPELRQPTVLFPLGRETAGFGQSIQGVSVLYPVGGVAVNLVRGLALVFTKLSFLAVLGLVCATFLTFPVASFTAFSIFVLAVSMGFLMEIVGGLYVFGSGMVRPGTPVPVGDIIVRHVLAAGLYVLPDFRPYDPVPYLSDGVAVPWGLVAHGTVVLIAIRGTILAALGGLIFHRRELAALDR